MFRFDATPEAIRPVAMLALVVEVDDDELALLRIQLICATRMATAFSCLVLYCVWFTIFIASPSWHSAHSS